MPNIKKFADREVEIIYNSLKEINNITSSEAMPTALPHRYFDESQMIYSNKPSNIFYTDNVNECIVTILYNDSGELFAVHSNPAAIPEFPKIIAENFVDKDNLKVVFVGGKFPERNKEIAQNTLACTVNSLNESGREIEVVGCALGNSKSVMISIEDGKPKIETSTQELASNPEVTAMKSWNKLRTMHCMVDVEKYAWKPENNTCMWAFKEGEIAKPEIPEELLKNTLTAYETLGDDGKIILHDLIEKLNHNKKITSKGRGNFSPDELVRIPREYTDITAAFYKNITGLEASPRSNDLDVTLDLFNAIESGIITRPISPSPTPTPASAKTISGRGEAIAHSA